MSVELLNRVENQTLDDGSHDKFYHIVVEGWWPKDDNGDKTGQFVPETPVVDGVVFGTPVRALCGKVWIPGDVVDKYGACPTCIQIAKENGWKVPTQ